MGNHPGLLRWQVVFWDEWQRLPLPFLDEHLVLLMEHCPAEGQAVVEYVLSSRQRWAAQAALIELDVRRLERCPDIAAIGNAHRSLAAGELESPVSTLLRSFKRISEDVETTLHQGSTYNQRLTLSAIEERLDKLCPEVWSGMLCVCTLLQLGGARS
jgi:hypothetical protein